MCSADSSVTEVVGVGGVGIQGGLDVLEVTRFADGMTAVPSAIRDVRCVAAARTATGEEVPDWRCR
jgi:hypothetical protein